MNETGAFDSGFCVIGRMEKSRYGFIDFILIMKALQIPAGREDSGEK